MTAQVYRLFIKAPPERVWEAIVDPRFTERYFHGVRIEVTPQVRRSFWGGEFRHEVDVLEFEPPRRLVHAWVSYYDDETAAEPPSRVTWELELQEDRTTLLTVVHNQLEASPKTAENVEGVGWMYVLSGLKTLLETGEPLAAS